MGKRKETLSREEIHAMRGRYTLNTDGKPFSQWWAEHEREEIELEERKLQRLSALGKK